MDYKKMYYILFNEITDIITRLQRAQQITEEIAMQGEGRELRELSPGVEHPPDKEP